jgi:hypothetical protein
VGVFNFDVFISHSSADAAQAKRVEQALRRSRQRVWLDSSKIRVGSLLRDELQSQIEGSRVVVLLWSKAAARSRWVAAEVLTAFHTGRFIIPCSLDAATPPAFLENAVRVDFRRDEQEQLKTLRRAVREAPDAANELQPVLSAQEPELVEYAQKIAYAQRREMELVGGWRLDDARNMHAAVDDLMRPVEKRWRLDATVLNLAGYHRKNAYTLKHWEAIQAGRPPKDRLLERAERFFFETLFVKPTNYEALNGLGSILIYERDLNAAAFFIRRAIHYAGQDEVDYAEAKHDLEMILPYVQG